MFSGCYATIACRFGRSSWRSGSRWRIGVLELLQLPLEAVLAGILPL
jgi:hypothetical protein